MTWDSFHRRGEILRTVMAVADQRRDGLLPLDVEGVRETFEDELALIGALQLKWHTRLAGRIERELSAQPMDLEAGVISAWHATAAEMPGVRAVLDHYRAEPVDDAMAAALARATAKERTLLAVMAGLASASDAAAVRMGERVERAARESLPPQPVSQHQANRGLAEKIKAALAAA